MNFGLFLSLNSSNETYSSLLSDSESSNSGLIFSSYESDSEGSCGFDAFGGKDMFGSPDFTNFNTSFFAYDSVETAGSMASAETAGSIASAIETAGSVACSSGFDGGSSCGSFSSVC